jgi:uncharacterized membrane protein YgdD (TMEM256/DUF423 family)
MPSFVTVGGLSAALAVAAGAFGAHALKALPSERLAWWDTASRYHLALSLALVLFGVIRLQRPGSALAGLLLVAGTFIFCGSLYAMALGAPRWFGAITPLGGLAIIAGLATLAFSLRF